MIGHWQTIWAALSPPPAVRFERQRWETPDGDFIDVDFAGAASATRLMVLLHGLEGSSDSHYARLLAQALPAAGWRVAIPHWRGCSGEANRQPRAYHSGDTAEFDWIVRRFENPVDVIGVSLGGNVLLKWLGERGASDSRSPMMQRVAGAVAVSVPYDLARSSRHIGRGFARVYQWSFVRSLRGML